MADPIYIVTFYDNFREEDKANAGVAVTLPIFEEEEGVFYREWELRIQATGGSYLIHVFNDGKFVPPPSDTPTGAIAWDAAPGAVEAALQAVSEFAPGKEWLWEVVLIEPGLYKLRAYAVVVSGNPIFPNLSTDSTELTGHLVWVWDEIEYEVPLTFGCGVEEPPRGEITPEENEGGSRPVGHPVSGKRA